MSEQRTEAARRAWFAVQETLHDHLDGMIEWHPPAGADSHEQWEIETEAKFVRALKADGDLIDRLVAAALGPAGDPS